MKLGKKFYKILKFSEENTSIPSIWNNYFCKLSCFGKYDELVEAIKNYFSYDKFIFKNTEGNEEIDLKEFSDYINYLYGWMDKDGNWNKSKLKEWTRKNAGKVIIFK